MADVGKIRKLYKLGGGVGGVDAKGKRRRKDGSVEGSGGVGGGVGGGGGGGGEGKGEGGKEGDEAERERRELEVGVLGLMALRGAV